MENKRQNIPQDVYIDAGGKEKKIYERHDMSRIPVILHRDTVIGHSSTSNWHENVEILLFTEGSGTVYLEGVPYAFTAGDICVIDSGDLHRVESEKGTKCMYFCLIVDGDFCKRQGLATEDVRFVKKICDRELAEEYNKIAEAFSLHDEYRLPALKGAVLSFMVHLLREYAHAESKPAHSSDTGIRTAIRYIRSHYAESFTIDTLSSVAGFSKYHFLREFKRVTGQTAVDYVNTVRIEHAARMLGEADASVASVAAACGFGSHSYFSKLFYRMRGVHPSKLLSHGQKNKKQ